MGCLGPPTNESASTLTLIKIPQTGRQRSLLTPSLKIDKHILGVQPHTSRLCIYGRMQIGLVLR